MTMNEPLTPEQQSKVDALKAAVAETVDKYPAFRMFCIPHTYVRYLRARSWNVERATKMLQATLEWRLKMKPERILWSDVEEEAFTGKLRVLDLTDNLGRPVVAMVPRLENTKNPESQLRYLVYTLERASQRADDTGKGKMVWLCDFEGYTLQNAPSLGMMKATLNIVQNHYPERLGEAVCIRAPKIFEVTWKAVKPFIDPVTHKKITFIKRKKKNVFANLTASFSNGGGLNSQGSNGSFDSDAGILTADEEQLATKFDVSRLDESLGGRGTCPYHPGEYGEKMVAEDMQRDAMLAKVMA